MPALYNHRRQQQQQPPRTHYATLSLPLPAPISTFRHGVSSSSPASTAPVLTQDAIRLAYRASLLRWHPDKTRHVAAAGAATGAGAASADTGASSSMAMATPTLTSTRTPTPTSKDMDMDMDMDINSQTTPHTTTCCRSSNGSSNHNGNKHTGSTSAVAAVGPSIDDIKMAYHVLSDPRKRAIYDAELFSASSASPTSRHWLPPSGDMGGYAVDRTVGGGCCGGGNSRDGGRSSGGGGGCGGSNAAQYGHDNLHDRGGMGEEGDDFFIVGLGDSVPETVDLDDLVQEGDEDEEKEGEGGKGGNATDGPGAGAGASAGLSWSRSCRCGLHRGFVVTVDQLEEESEAGGREVLVQCLGCSLWLRVEFGVLEEEGEEEEEEEEEETG